MGGDINENKNQVFHKSNDDSVINLHSLSFFHILSNKCKFKSQRKGSDPIFLRKDMEQYIQQISNNKSIKKTNVNISRINQNDLNNQNQQIDNSINEKNIQYQKNNNLKTEKTINQSNSNSNQNQITEKNSNNQNKSSDINYNIKKIFYERINNNQNKESSFENLSHLTDNSNNNISFISYSINSNEDYELNFYRSGEEIRSSYITKLICKKIWIPSSKNKTHNSIIIFDWDDTLLCTSYLTKNGLFDDNNQLSLKDKEKISKLEISVYNLLSIALEKGDVFIITNANLGWVEYSAEKYYPSILSLLKNVKIISAREEYEYYFPDDPRMWKIQSFLNMQRMLNLNLVTNIICLGDSFIEIEAGKILASKFNQAYIKTVKFREFPKPDELNKQLNLVLNQFNFIYKSIKNLTIRVEKKN